MSNTVLSAEDSTMNKTILVSSLIELIILTPITLVNVAI